MADYLTNDADLKAVADAIRAKGGTSAPLMYPDGFVSAIGAIKSAPTLQDKTVTPGTAAQEVTPDSGYDGLSKVTVGAMPSGALAEPSVSASGVITSKVGIAGYLSAGTQKAKQLPTQAAKTVTPSTTDQTAVSSGVYTTGNVIVKGDANLLPENIKDGVTIFGKTGTYAGQTGDTTVAANSVDMDGDYIQVTFNTDLTGISNVKNLSLGGLVAYLNNNSQPAKFVVKKVPAEGTWLITTLAYIGDSWLEKYTASAQDFLEGVLRFYPGSSIQVSASDSDYEAIVMTYEDYD